MKTLVFFHGWGAGGRIWRGQVEAFSSQGIKVLAPTLPTWEVSRLTAYLQTLPLAETVLVGWSLGGMLLVEALSRELLAPGGLTLVAASASFVQRPDYPVGQPPAAVRALRRAVRADSRGGLADFAGRCLAPGEADFQEAIFQEFIPRENGADLAAGLDYLLTADLRPRLPRIRGRCLILQGDRDAVAPPAQAEVLRRGLPDARVVKFPGAGHAPFITQAADCNEVVQNFLKERAGVGASRSPDPQLSPEL
jgi:pimeloyl-[acyl-carrier protein] methyl ester esterase